MEMEPNESPREGSSTLSPVTTSNRKNALRSLLIRPSSLMRRWRQDNGETLNNMAPNPSGSTLQSSQAVRAETAHPVSRDDTGTSLGEHQGQSLIEVATSVREEGRPGPRGVELRTRYSFHGTPDSDELDVAAGVTLIGLSRNIEWWVAVDENDRVGVIPVSYCRIV